MASRATIELHESLALVLELGIIHEIGGIVVSIRMLQGDQVARDVAGVLLAQP
jgi:hypothetical protein